MVRATGLFREDEVATADEVLLDAATKPDGDGYRALVAEVGGQLAGWSCHGLIPMSDAAYDLYWIIVDPRFQRHGVGRRLVASVAEKLHAAGGRWLIAETSAQESYAGTQSFYRRAGFALVGDVPDFYRQGDGRLTYGLRVAD